MSTSFESTIKALFLENYEEWCALSFRYVGEMAQAEDIVQEVVFKILQKERKKDILNIKAYISMAVRNDSLKFLKAMKKRELLDFDPVSGMDTEEERWITMENNVRIEKALDLLPEQRKRVFELCVLEGVKYKNAADALGISTNTVKYHLKKAFQTLRLGLGNFYLWTLFVVIFFFFK